MIRATSFLASRNTFSSLIQNVFNRSSNWSNVDNLFSNSLSTNDQQSPEAILKVAYKGLKYQIFDSSFWSRINDLAIKTKNDFTPSHWVKLIHIYKRIKIRNNDLYNIALEQLDCDLNSLSLKEISILALSFSYFSICPTTLLNSIAKVICCRHQISKLKEVESLINNRLADTQSVKSNNTPTIIQGVNDTVSYIHLIGAYAKCGFDCKVLFEVATDNIIKNINSGVNIPPNLIMKFLNSYSRFGYRHNELFDLLSGQIVTSRLSNEDLHTIKSIFTQLNYENATMNEIFSYRLGNSSQ